MNKFLWAGVVGLWLAACGAPPEEPQEVAEAALNAVLPPSGAYSVGTVVFSWTDSERGEPATEDPGDFRQLIGQLWYPAVPSDGETFPYFPDLKAFQATFGEAYPEALGAVQTQSITGAPLAEGPFPVVLFFHGWNAQRSAYTGLLQDIASHGYIVLGLDQPYAGRVALPSGVVTPSRDDHFSSPEAMLESYGADALFALKKLADLGQEDERFAGHLALEQVVAIGHSNGAISAAQASHLESNVRGTIFLDSFSPEVEFLYRFTVPLLLVRTGGATPPSEAYRTSITTPVYDLEIPGGEHRSAVDGVYLEAEGPEREQAEKVAKQLRHAVVTFLDAVFLDAVPQLPTEEAILTVLQPTE